jgi:hypothetical protein
MGWYGDVILDDDGNAASYLCGCWFKNKEN